MNWKLITLIIILVNILVLPPLYSNSNDTKKLFEKKCGACHPFTKCLKRTKTQDSWYRVVERMRKKWDTLFTESEGRKIAEYLHTVKGKRSVVVKSKKREPKKAESPQPIISKNYKEFPKDNHFKFKSVEVNQFIEPQVCAGCHEDIFNQWESSLHSNSFKDPLWQKSVKIFAKDAKTDGQKLETQMCVKCHAPLGFRSGDITKPEEDFEKVPELVKQGIFCNWCHNISEAKSIGNADYEVSPGNGEDDPSTMLGPFKDAKSSFHPTMYSKLHTKSEFCGLCHNVSHSANLTPIENTYDEWKNSPYNTGNPETTVHCQDCHMRQTLTVAATGKTERPDNPGFVCSEGPKRPHVPTHYIVGGNTIKGDDLCNNTQVKLATARLKNAANIEIIKSGIYRKSSVANIKVKVINSGAGHYLPTGMTEIRQMWLDIKITDKHNRLLYSSGSVNKNGDIEPNAVIFQTVLGDSNGLPVINIALADRVLFDKRIPPKGYAIENYTFFIPGYVADTLQIKAILRYRSTSQSFANLTLEEKAPIIPIVDMAQTILDINL